MHNQSDMFRNGCENTTFTTTTRFLMEVQVNNNVPDYLELFKAISEKVVDKDGDVYYHCPFYYKATNEENIFQMFKFDELPGDVQELISLKKDTNA